MKSACMVLAIFVSGAATAAVPLSWEVKPGQASPVAFDRFHGESLQLSAEFVGFSEPPFAPGADVRLWYQTNGMGSAWWSVPASVESNRVSAAWSPELDPGAERVNLFFGAPSNAYCSAVLRLRGSPGMVPNALPLPVQRLDFAALEVTNAPYYTQDETDAKIVELAPAPGNYAAVSNAAMSASAATNDFVRKHGDTVTGTLTVKGAGISTQKTTIGNTGISTPNITLFSAMEMAWLYPWCLTVRSEYAEDDETFYYPVGSGGGTIALTKDIDAAAAAATNHAAAAAASAYADATNYTDSATNTLGRAIADGMAAIYLPLSGGAMTGKLTLAGDFSFEINRAPNRYLRVDCPTIYPHWMLMCATPSNPYFTILLPDRGGTLSLLQDLAPEFSTSATYAQTALCIYNGVLYRCTNANGHTGAWDANDFVVTTVEDVLAAKYAKPSGGIPKADLASAVQTSLDKADAAAAWSGTAITWKIPPPAQDNPDTPWTRDGYTPPAEWGDWEEWEEFDIVLVGPSHSSYTETSETLCVLAFGRAARFAKDTSFTIAGTLTSGVQGHIDFTVNSDGDILCEYYYDDSTVPFTAGIINGDSTYREGSATVVAPSAVSVADTLTPEGAASLLDSPALTGTPTAPDITAQSPDGQVANKKYVDGKVSTAGDETIAGHKTFSGPVTVGTRYEGATPGAGSFSQGLGNNAHGNYASCNGVSTTADGTGAHAGGYNGVAAADYSHTEGWECFALPQAGHSHAEGRGTITVGEGSHSDGFRAMSAASGTDIYTAGNPHRYSYVWQGWDGINSQTGVYHSHGHGTFNVNPLPEQGSTDPATGFWIGEKNLPAVIRDSSAVAMKLDVSEAADEFSPSNTYAVGSAVAHEGRVYICTTAVTTVGAWNAANWTHTTLAGLLARRAPLVVVDDEITTTLAAGQKINGDDVYFAVHWANNVPMSWCYSYALSPDEAADGIVLCGSGINNFPYGVCLYASDADYTAELIRIVSIPVAGTYTIQATIAAGANANFAPRDFDVLVDSGSTPVIRHARTFTADEVSTITLGTVAFGAGEHTIRLRGFRGGGYHAILFAVRGLKIATNGH